MFQRWQALRNEIDYFLRQKIHWHRAGKDFANEEKEALFDDWQGEKRRAAEEKAQALAGQYHLERFFAHSRRNNYRETLYYLEMLEHALDLSHPTWPAEQRLEAADIGPSTWFYVQGYAALLRGWQTPRQRSIHLTGFETDAYRLYPGFYSRFDYAQAYLRGLEAGEVTYLPRAFTPQPAAFDLITMLFPFVFLRDHRLWGLPDRLFDPPALLAAAWQSLKPGGVLVVVNQGEEEHAAQRAFFERQKITVRAAYRVESLLFSYDLPRYLLLTWKEGPHG